MPWMPREAPRCPACKTPVYPAEHVMAADRKPYHRGCVKCAVCRTSLSPRTLNEHEEKLYCNNCYEKYLNPQEYTVYGINGNLTEEDRLRIFEKERIEQEMRDQMLLQQQQQQQQQLQQQQQQRMNQNQGQFSVSSGIKVKELVAIAPNQQILAQGL